MQVLTKEVLTNVSLAFQMGETKNTDLFLCNILVDKSFIDAAPLAECAVGFIAPALITFITTGPMTEEETLDVWEKTRSIDDPLQPWTEIYSK